MNLVDLLTSVATIFAFAYLTWALLRPEDI
jgi:hypothetical protein